MSEVEQKLIRLFEAGFNPRNPHPKHILDYIEITGIERLKGLYYTLNYRIDDPLRFISSARLYIDSGNKAKSDLWAARLYQVYLCLNDPTVSSTFRFFDGTNQLIYG